jgi:hypothetical protein
MQESFEHYPSRLGEMRVAKQLPIDLVAFWSSDQARKLKDAEQIRSILQSIGAHSGLLFDLTFYGRFAEKIFVVMKREGKDTVGFDRMQQSFTEAVDKVRHVLVESGKLGFPNASRFTSLDAHSFGRLVALIGDLAILKDWMLSAASESETG